MLPRRIRKVGRMISSQRFFAAIVTGMTVSLLGCGGDASERAPGPAGGASNPSEQVQATAGTTRIVELREAEYKTTRHPEMEYYAGIQTDGLRVSFQTTEGNFGHYSFPTNGFPIGEPVLLSAPGQPDLLPLRVVRLDNEGMYQTYRIEWLPGFPAAGNGERVVRSY